jgi:hypothetical protein
MLTIRLLAIALLVPLFAACATTQSSQSDGCLCGIVCVLFPDKATPVPGTAAPAASSSSAAAAARAGAGPLRGPDRAAGR